MKKLKKEHILNTDFSTIVEGNLKSVTGILESKTQKEMNLKNDFDKKANYELLTIAVDIDDNINKTLIINSNDDLKKVTHTFCEENNLGDEQKIYLLNHIKENLVRMFGTDIDILRNPESDLNSILQKDPIQTITIERKEIEEQKYINDYKSKIQEKSECKDLSQVISEEILNIKESLIINQEYQPKINEQSKKIVNSKCFNNPNVFKRLSSNSKMKSTILNNNANQDLIVKENNEKKNLTNLSIFINLYKKGKEFVAKKQKLEKEKVRKSNLDELIHATFKPKINSHS